MRKSSKIELLFTIATAIVIVTAAVASAATITLCGVELKAHKSKQFTQCVYAVRASTMCMEAQ